MKNIWTSACGMCDQQKLRSACSYMQSDQSLCSSLECSMSVKLLTEHLLEVLSLKGGCTCSSKSTLVKMPHCWKSYVTAHFHLEILNIDSLICSMSHFRPIVSNNIVCFVVLRPKSTAMVMAGRSLHLTTLFSWASLSKQLTSTSCTYFRL